jgi:uncharacterized protein (TIGR03000 family)
MQKGDAPVTLVVHVSPDAKLFVEGALTKQTGVVRTFTSPKLEAGTYTYTLKVEVTRQGKAVQEEKKVKVRAGETTDVFFDLFGGSTAQAIGKLKGTQGLWLDVFPEEKIVFANGKVQSEVQIGLVAKKLKDGYQDQSGWTVYWNGLISSPATPTAMHKKISRERIGLIERAIQQIEGARDLKVKASPEKQEAQVEGKVTAEAAAAEVRAVLLDAFRPALKWKVDWNGVIK